MHPRTPPGYALLEIEPLNINYEDKCVLLENTTVIKFIRNYIRDLSRILFTSSLVRIRRRHISRFSVVVCAQIQFAYEIKRKLHGGLKTLVLFTRVSSERYIIKSM